MKLYTKACPRHAHLQSTRKDKDKVIANINKSKKHERLKKKRTKVSRKTITTWKKQ